MSKPVVRKENLDEFFKKMYSFPSNTESKKFWDAHDFDMDSFSFSQLNKARHKYWRNLDIKVMTDTISQVAGRYHFLLLTKLVLGHIAKGTEASREEKGKTFRQYEEKFKQIEEGNISDEEIIYLQSLPPTNEWNNYEFTIEELSVFYKD